MPCLLQILARLGVSVVSSIADATHFIADQFVRTRNMLEAIALGKPVVTHLWIESCGQANCFIDEKNYILRDAKKEKEFGFSMPVSLARASQHPLLKVNICETYEIKGMNIECWIMHVYHQSGLEGGYLIFLKDRC